MKLVKLNLGCGKDLREGWCNVDRIEFEGIDIVHDLNSMPYPFLSCSADLILMSHCLEHLNDPLSVLKELARIITPNGRIVIIVPHFSTAGAYSPFHKTLYNSAAFDPLAGSWNDKSLDNVDKIFATVKKRIRLMRGWWLLNYILEPIININPFLFERSPLVYLIPVRDIVFVLRKKAYEVGIGLPDLSAS